MHIAFISMRYPRSESEWVRIYERKLVKHLKNLVDLSIFSHSLSYKEKPYSIDGDHVELISIIDYSKIQKLYDKKFGFGAAVLDLINDFLKIMGTTARIHRLNKRKKVDVILAASYSMSAFYPLLVAKLKRIPLVTQAFGYDVDVVPEIGYGLRAKSSKQRMFSTIALKHSDLLMPNSKGLAEDTVLNGYKGKVVVIHHGVDLDKYSLDSKKTSGRRQEESRRELLVLNVGGLIKVKGWKYIVETANKLKKHNIKFVIIGRNSDLKEYNERISELKLNNLEFFDSPSHEVLKKYYKNADIFFLPSLSEGLPNSMLEASAMENALIGSGKGGTRDIIVEGENGYYIREPNSEAFAEKILFLYKHPDVLAKMKRRSRKLVGKGFKWEDNAKRMAAAFQKLIDKSN